MDRRNGRASGCSQFEQEVRVWLVWRNLTVVLMLYLVEKRGWRESGASWGVFSRLYIYFYRTGQTIYI